MSPSSQETICGVCFFAGLLLVYLFAILPAWYQNRELSIRIAELQAKAQQLRHQNKLFVKEIHALQSDPYYIEFLLRKYLHYGRKGEKVVVPPMSH